MGKKLKPGLQTGSVKLKEIKLLKGSEGEKTLLKIFLHYAAGDIFYYIHVILHSG